MFHLGLLDHYWINGSRFPDGDPEDVTSHGKVSLMVNGVEISGCDDDNTDYGINQAAVELLKTVFEPRISKRDDPIFPHGCCIWCSCPNCVLTFSVTHDGSEVLLSDFYVSGGAKGADCRRFSHLRATVPFLDYATEVVGFARDALALLPEKKESDRYENESYVNLLRLHRQLLSLVNRAIKNGGISPEIDGVFQELVSREESSVSERSNDKPSRFANLIAGSEWFFAFMGIMAGYLFLKGPARTPAQFVYRLGLLLVGAIGLIVVRVYKKRIKP